MDDTVVGIVFCVLIIFWIGAFVIQADAYKVLVWSPFLFLLVFGLAEEVLRVTWSYTNAARTTTWIGVITAALFFLCIAGRAVFRLIKNPEIDFERFLKSEYSHTNWRGRWMREFYRTETLGGYRAIIFWGGQIILALGYCAIALFWVIYF